MICRRILPKELVYVAGSNCFSDFYDGNGFGNRKWYQGMKQNFPLGTSFCRDGNVSERFPDPRIRLWTQENAAASRLSFFPFLAGL